MSNNTGGGTGCVLFMEVVLKMKKWFQRLFEILFGHQTDYKPPVIINTTLPDVTTVVTPPISTAAPLLPPGQYVGINWTDLWPIFSPEQVCREAAVAGMNYLGIIIMGDCVEGRMPESGSYWSKQNWKDHTDELRIEVRRLVKVWADTAAGYGITMNLTIQRDCDNHHENKQVDPLAITDRKAWLLNWATWILGQHWRIIPHIDGLAEYGMGRRDAMIAFLRKLDNTGIPCVGSFHKGAAENGWFEYVSCHTEGTPIPGYKNIWEPDCQSWVARAFPEGKPPNCDYIQETTERALRNKNCCLPYAYNRPYLPSVVEAVRRAMQKVYG